MSLPAAKDLRARAAEFGRRAARSRSGRPRERFLREQRRRLVTRLLPVLATIALATGAAAVTDLFHSSVVSRWASLAQGLTAATLAALALATMLLKRRYTALLVITAASAVVVSIGWGAACAWTGGVTSPYALAVPLSLVVLAVTVPLPPWLVPSVAATGAIAMGIAAPGATPSLFVMFGLLAVGGWAIARRRRKSALVSFRRMERLGGAIARLHRVQEQLVVVEKLEALRVLVGGIAHELNNGLAVSLASTEQVLKIIETDPQGAAKAATRAQGGLVRIRATIDRLKRFAMAEEAVLEPADVAAMLDFALESAIGRARSGVVIERNYDPDLGPFSCHVSALAEALFQVAKNAVESMPAGGTVRASTRRDGDRVILSVADEGKGIPAERLAKVFDPYYARENMETFRGGQLLGGSPGKNGLGLSMVYGLVSMMGGRVDIKSQVGEGTEVSIVLDATRR